MYIARAVIDHRFSKNVGDSQLTNYNEVELVSWIDSNCFTEFVVHNEVIHSIDTIMPDIPEHDELDKFQKIKQEAVTDWKYKKGRLKYLVK